MTRELDTWFPSNLQLLVKHAPDYLPHEQCDALLVQHIEKYYRFLGKCLMLGRDEAFWNYHKSELSKAGIAFKRTRLVKGVLETLCMAAINPGDTLLRMLQSKRLRRSRGRMPLRAGKSDARAVNNSQNASDTV
jgi:hypothetical protein